MSYETLFIKLWNDYVSRNPHVSTIHQLFINHGETVINDHIALRTFNDPRVNIEHLAKPFLRYGYQEKGQYNFPIKKLFAKHYEHPNPESPKVFISELLLQDCSSSLQSIAEECINKIPPDLLDTEELLTSGSLWQPLSYKTYQTLLEESEYAAWMYAFGFCANHFTVDVNKLKNWHTIQEVNQFLEQHDVKLNSSGGLIKGTPQECLEQSSTLAGDIDVKFIEGVYRIPSCYYEFAKRYPLPNGNLYTGFIAASADKIFESTDVGAR